MRLEPTASLPSDHSAAKQPLKFHDVQPSLVVLCMWSTQQSWPVPTHYAAVLLATCLRFHAWRKTAWPNLLQTLYAFTINYVRWLLLSSVSLHEIRITFCRFLTSGELDVWPLKVKTGTLIAPAEGTVLDGQTECVVKSNQIKYGFWGRIYNVSNALEWC